MFEILLYFIMNTFKSLYSLFSRGKSKRRRTRGRNKRQKRRNTRRYKMRGGWGGDMPANIKPVENPNITYIQYKGVGGWGPAIPTL